MDVDSVLRLSVVALRARWGSSIGAEVVGELSSSDRSLVLRIAMFGGDAPAATAVVKAYADGATWQNEAAGATYFGRAGAGLTPRLLALDGPARTVVLSDLGDHRQLSDVLLGDDWEAAERALLDWAHSLGSVLSRTFGGRAGLERARSELGLGPAPEPWWDAQMRTACGQLAEVAQSRLGLAVPAGLDDELTGALTLLDDRALEVVSPADMCPDNNLLTPHGIRFLDLEFSGCSPVFLEAAYARMPFPSCWCLLDSPPGLLQRVEATLRRPLVEAKPELGDDALWRLGIARGCLLCTVLRTVVLLNRPPAELLTGTWERDGVTIPAWDRITMHFLSRAEQTIGSDLPATTDLLLAIHKRMTEKYGDLDVAVYPAFRKLDPEQ